jgi:hypothetical protein
LQRFIVTNSCQLVQDFFHPQCHPLGRHSPLVIDVRSQAQGAISFNFAPEGALAVVSAVFRSRKMKGT